MRYLLSLPVLLLGVTALADDTVRRGQGTTAVERDVFELQVWCDQHLLTFGVRKREPRVRGKIAVGNPFVLKGEGAEERDSVAIGKLLQHEGDKYRLEVKLQMVRSGCETTFELTAGKPKTFCVVAGIVRTYTVLLSRRGKG